MSYPNLSNHNHRSLNSKRLVATKRSRDKKIKRKMIVIKKLLKEREEMNMKIKRLESLVA